MSKPSDIGVIGIGLLGSAIAARLIAHDLGVRGYDSDPMRMAEFQHDGGQGCDGVAEVIRNSQRLIFSLPTSDVVQDLINRHADDFRAGHVVIDTTTGDPEQSIANIDRLARMNVEYVEANVAGSSDQMREGQATLFLGGQAETIVALGPLLDILSQQRFHLGPVGSASRMKLVHNLVLGLHRAVLAEGLNFAQAIGIDPSEALQILKSSPAASAVMESKGNRMVKGDFTPQARLAQHLKDVRLILAAAERSECRTPLSLAHRQLLEEAVHLDFGELDNSAIVKVFAATREAEE